MPKLKEYIKDPVGSIKAKIVKREKDKETRRKVELEFQNGNYSDKKIDIDWKKAGPERYELINNLIKDYNYKTYLEIGCRGDDCFDEIKIDHRVGVDPNQGGTLKMTSDEYFEKYDDKFDIIFIDGLHTYEQVIKDINNSVKVLNDNGVILLHDCCPTECYAQYDFPVINQWNGDVWKAIVEARTFDHIDSAVCMIDHGVGVIRKRPNSKKLKIECENFKELKYPYFIDNYEELINPIKYDDIMGWIKND